MNLALLSLYSMVTSDSDPANIPFNRFNGFLGIMNSATWEAETSLRWYFTNLCASVATNVKFSVENWKNTPLITGRRSSFPAAKMVLVMAVANISPRRVVVLGLETSTALGNSAPSAYAKAYLP